MDKNNRTILRQAILDILLYVIQTNKIINNSEIVYIFNVYNFSKTKQYCRYDYFVKYIIINE